LPLPFNRQPNPTIGARPNRRPYPSVGPSTAHPSLEGLRFNEPFVEVMSKCQIRVVEQHPRSGKPHHLPHSLSHVRLIAMDRAPRTSGFILPERAFIEPAHGVREELLALRAQMPLAVVLSTKNADHCLNRATLTLDPSGMSGSRFVRSVCHGSPRRVYVAEPIDRPPKAPSGEHAARRVRFQALQASPTAEAHLCQLNLV